MEAAEFENRMMKEAKLLESFSYVLTRNRDDAMDLLQETFLKALMHKESFKEDTNIRAWLFTIMKNTFINTYRKSKRVSMIIESENIVSYFNNCVAQGCYTADHDVNFQTIKEMIASLPEEQSVPFEMMNQGYKYQEIADAFDISIGTVKSRIFLARKKLMDGLEDEQ